MALVVPFFATLIIGVVDLSRAYSAKLQLEQAAYRAVEKVQQYQISDSTVGTLKTEAPPPPESLKRRPIRRLPTR